MNYDELVHSLESAGNNTRCIDLIRWLEAAGFVVKKGNNGNHYTFTHPGIKSSGFTTSNFACEHGGRPNVKKRYIRKVLNQVIKKYEPELREFLRGNTL